MMQLWTSRIIAMRMFFPATCRVGLRSLLAGLLLFAVWGCATNPYSGKRQLLFTTEAEEVELGVQAYAEMTGPGSAAILKEDPEWLGPLQRVGQAIAAVADKPEFEWEFRLIDDPDQVNAWCVSGGKIAFYTGIYPILQDEAGMAIVMGHEVAHALLRHGGERIAANLLTRSVMYITAGPLKDNKIQDHFHAAVGVDSQIGRLLPTSRSQENVADELGLVLAAQAGYDPEAAFGVWQRMAARGGSGPGFLSTHPSPGNRIENFQQWMPEAKRLYELSNKKPNGLLPKL